MKLLPIILYILALTACQSSHPGPSLAPIKGDIGNGIAANTEAQGHLMGVQTHLDTADYKGGRANGFFQGEQ